MDVTSFVATAIQRIARKRLTSTLIWSGGLFIAFLCFLGLLWLMKFPGIGYPFVILAGLIVGGLVIRSALILSRSIRNPFESFFLSELKPYGPLQQTIEQIDREASSYNGKIGSFVTQHWVISALSNSFTCIRLEDIVWIYKRLAESRVSFYYAITVSSSKTYAAQIWSRSGCCVSIPSTEKGVDGLLEAIGKAAPWVTQGYTEVINEAWRSHCTDFIAAVDRRRQQILSGVPDFSVEISGYDPFRNGRDLTPGDQLLQAAINQAAQFSLNDPANQALMEAYQAKQDRKVRVMGSIALLAGFVLSYFFILPLVRNILEITKDVSISREGIFLSMMFLIIGGYYSAFGQNGKRFLEDFLFKNWWTTILFFILLCGGFMLFIAPHP